MLQALWWWLVVQVLALCATPLCLALFRPLADRGYGLSKTFGTLLFGYAVWLVVILQLLPNGPLAMGVAVAAIAGGSYAAWRRDPAGLGAFLRRRRGLLLLQEAVFLVAYLGFLAIRVRNPNIEGTEKFMDFAFMNAVTRSATFPPLDPWLAPSPSIPNPVINYYHFGYLIQGLLLQLTGVAPAAGFNLALATLFALAAVGVFSVGYSLARDIVAAGAAPRRRSASADQQEPPRRAASGPPGAGGRTPAWSLRAALPYVGTGALAAYMLLVAGNLWTALRRFDGSGLWEKDFWQGIGWNATRVLVIRQGDRDVDYTINEFPSFSFLLGDLHPHVLALPFAVMAVGLAYVWLVSPPALFSLALAGAPLPGGTLGARLAPFAGLVPGALVLGALYFLNSWDFPAYFVLAQAAAIGGAWALRAREATHRPGALAGAPASAPADADAPADGGDGAERGVLGVEERPGPSWGRVAGVAALCGILAIALFLPFHLTFRPPVVAEEGGLRLPLGIVAQRSLLSQFLQFWGAQLLLLAPCIVAGIAAGAQSARRPLSASLERARATGIVLREAPGWEPALALGGAAAAVLVAERLQSGVLVLCLLVAGGAGWAARRALERERALAFAFGAICLASLLLAACEVVYIRDFYGGALRRMNTVFKLYYQAWLLFAVGGSAAAFWLLRRLRRQRAEPGGRLAHGAMVVAGAALVAATLLFPYRVTLLRTNAFQNPATLDGMDWMRRFHPEDYAAAQWLRQHAATPRRPAPVILEATGGAYTEFSRLSTQTGFPTVLGWDQHERLWRGAAIDKEVDTRKQDVDAIYNAATLAQAKPLLDKYSVVYIAVGYLEQQKYGPAGGLAKFEAAASAGELAVAFRQGSTTIYQTTR